MHNSALASDTQANPHIIVVDDDPEIRQLLSQVLERYGFRATSVSCGSSLWPVIERDAPDLVVLDLMLPGDEGLSVCRSLRRRSGVPVIMLTARANRWTASWDWRSAQMTTSPNPSIRANYSAVGNFGDT